VVLHNAIPVTGPSLERGIVFRELRLFPWLTVERNVATGLENAPLNAVAKRKLTADVRHCGKCDPELLLPVSGRALVSE
jgi:ABC-type taurine transport system ATPase subunit